MAPRCAVAVLILAALTATPAQAWKNGPPDNKVTNSAADCLAPPYSTHDWIADHARALLPSTARAWLDPHRVLMLIGTEAPDYAKIEAFCGAPNRGYNDTGQGRHDLRFDANGGTTRDLPAQRAQEEYEKAVQAYRAGRPDHAAYFLGAAMHYIGDLAQYGHTIKGETHHADFEEWVGALTPSFAGGGVFEKFIVADGMTSRRADDAVLRTGRYTWTGTSPVLPPAAMDARFGPAALADTAFVASIGHCLNKAVNEAADMLFGFYEAVVRPNTR
ncbi:MAG: zinc dependent phospholipase C family protein [Alphaproteobacteria bacterium]